MPRSGPAPAAQGDASRKKSATFRFYAELNDFLAPEHRMIPFARSFRESASVKDMIEALGVPHTEVDLILANGESVHFSYLVRDGDRVSVYPVFESIDVAPLVRVRPAPLRATRFVLDAHLGRLAGYLRMLGFDSLYRNDYGDEELARVSVDERRILLTRDRGLLKRTIVTHGYCLRETHPRRQLAEVAARFDLTRSIAPFCRCMSCNALLRSAEKAEVEGRLLPRTRRHYDSFRLCTGCGRIYWEGSHFRRMREIIESLISPEALPPLP